MSDETYTKRLFLGISLSLGWATYGLFAAEYLPCPVAAGVMAAALVAAALEIVRRKL